MGRIEGRTSKTNSPVAHFFGQFGTFATIGFLFEGTVALQERITWRSEEPDLSYIETKNYDQDKIDYRAGCVP
ncbi:hypothetical protein [Pontibacter qinzhouensis]|uniref:hypothetical protein n=1 Tax=Pontibacter qinzhouensis TaxID=2603253 RepID=UPI0016501BCC|nr:hypothetical protein [Pontibacter qinzhouensis]